MTSNELRRKVLSTFKSVHKVRLLCSKNDDHMLNAQDVENELKTQVFQAERVDEKKLKFNLDPERHTYENILYAELDDETYRKWKEEKKKGMKKNQKCPCD